MAPKKPKSFDGDDGHTVAPMNVDGMPWYIPAEQRLERSGSEPEPMGRKERRGMLLGVLAAAFAVAAAFGVVFLLFILFCTNVWFK